MWCSFEPCVWDRKKRKLNQKFHSDFRFTHINFFFSKMKSVQFHYKTVQKLLTLIRNERWNKTEKYPKCFQLKTISNLQKQAVALSFFVSVDSPFFRCCFRYLNEQSEIRTSPPYGVYVYLCIVRNCQLNYMKMPSCFLFIEALELCAISQSFSISLALLGDESKLNFTSTRFNQRTGKIPCKKASINSFNDSNLPNFCSVDSKWILFWDGNFFFHPLFCFCTHCKSFPIEPYHHW